MQNIRANCSVWAKKTYQEGLDSLHIEDAYLKKLVLDIFDSLQISNIPMDGYSCEKLPKTEESRIGIRKTYSEFFHEELEKGTFTPASYLASIIKECSDNGIEKSKTVGTTARGLRTLTSLLREPDFAIALKTVLQKEDKEVSTNLNAKQDSGDHTDVLLKYKGKTYRIWLYQFSSRGLPHDIERLTGKRGELPNGVHLICPLHTEKAIAFDALQKKQEKLLAKKEKTNSELCACSARAIKKRETLRTKLQEIEKDISEIEPQLHIEAEESAKELDIVNGWYFYSIAHIQKIAAYINRLSSPMSYESVVQILSAPEMFVGEINAFVKGEKQL